MEFQLRINQMKFEIKTRKIEDLFVQRDPFRVMYVYKVSLSSFGHTL